MIGSILCAYPTLQFPAMELMGDDWVQAPAATLRNFKTELIRSMVLPQPTHRSFCFRALSPAHVLVKDMLHHWVWLGIHAVRKAKFK